MATHYVLLSSWGDGAVSDIQNSQGSSPNNQAPLHCVQARKDVSQSTSSTIGVGVDELNCELKYDAVYSFEYNLMYSISGLAVGAQFGIDMASGSATSLGYCVMMAANGTSLQSVATTTVGTLIGSGSSFMGGGPWTCIITGAMKTGSTHNNSARLLFKGSGIGVSVTIHPNSCAYFQEV